MKYLKIVQYNVIFITALCLLLTNYSGSSVNIYSMEYQVSNMLQRANDYLSDGEADYAIQMYDEILKINRTNTSALNYKGLAFASMGNYNEAIKIYNEVLTVDPNDVLALNNKGVALYNLGNYDDAIQMYNKILDLNPNDSDAKYNKSIALSSLNQSQDSNVSFDQ